MKHTAFGNREMEELRFHDAVNEAVHLALKHKQINAEAEKAIEGAVTWVRNLTVQSDVEVQAGRKAASQLEQAVDLLERLPSGFGMEELEADIDRFLEKYWEK